MKKYRAKNKERINDYLRNKMASDYIFALKVRVRKAIYNSFKRKSIAKNSEAEKILGCDINTFINHLLNTYRNIYGVDWNGKDKVQIDHIIPLVLAKNEKEVIELCHYTNLQLLKAKDNRDKSDKLDWNLDVI